MYAIIETGGKQYRVTEGDTIYIEKLDVEEGSSVSFDTVFAVETENGLVVGSPTVAGAVVEAKAIKNGKAKKVVIFKYRSKKDSKTKKGHRQFYTKVQIIFIKA